MGGATPRLGVLSSIRKQVEQASKQHPSMASESDSRFLPCLSSCPDFLQRCIIILVWFSIAVKRHHDYSNSYKGKYLIGNSLQFQKFGSWWCVAGMVLEKELRVLHLDPQAAGATVCTTLNIA